MRFLPAGDDALLVQLANLDEVLALFASLRAQPVPGMGQMIPAAQTLLIGFDPHRISAGQLAADLAPRDLSAKVSGESFSGDLNAPGAKIEREEFGPGSSFHTRYGAGKGEVRIETFSGDATLRLQ